MRIAVVLPDLADTGANRVSLDRAARWHTAGDDVTVFVVLHQTSGTRVPIPSGLRVLRASAVPRRLRSALPAAIWQLTRLARRCDVLVAGTEIGFGLLLAVVAARSARRPFAVTVQSRVDAAVNGYVGRRLQPVTRAALRRADLAVCVSSGLVPGLLALGLRADRVVVVSNAVARDEIQAGARDESDLVPTGRGPIVVAAGRLEWQKGFDLLLRAHARALASGAPVHRLLILGGGRERDALLALARELGVEDSVTLPGFVANPHAVVARAAVFVLSSRWEGFGLSLAEALACGTACVAFDCIAGPAEVLGGGCHGALVPAEDVAALAEAIGVHLRDPGPLTRRARRAAAAELEIFRPDRPAEIHRAALAALVSRAGQSGTGATPHGQLAP